MATRPILCEDPPEVQFRGGNVLLTLGDDRHPDVAVPVHVMRRWCETTLICINEWQADQDGRQVLVRLRAPEH